MIGDNPMRSRATLYLDGATMELRMLGLLMGEEIHLNDIILNVLKDLIDEELKKDAGDKTAVL